MTKVLMNTDLLEYQREMNDALRRVIQENFVGGIRQPEWVEPPIAQENLLPPPYVKHICLEFYEGGGDDFIGVVAYNDFGIHSLHITIVDEHGNQIESGEADPLPQDPGLWSFYPVVAVPPGTCVTVQVTAMDCMHGIGSRCENKMLERNGPE